MPMLRECIDNDLAPFVKSRFASKAKTLVYKWFDLQNRPELEALANSPSLVSTGNWKYCGGCGSWRRNGARRKSPCRR